MFFKRFCRFCAQENNELLLIENLNSSILEWLSNIINITKGNFPDKICYKCLWTVENIDCFIDKCKESLEFFENQLEKHESIIEEQADGVEFIIEKYDEKYTVQSEGESEDQYMENYIFEEFYLSDSKSIDNNPPLNEQNFATFEYDQFSEQIKNGKNMLETIVDESSQEIKSEFGIEKEANEENRTYVGQENFIEKVPIILKTSDLKQVVKLDEFKKITKMLKDNPSKYEDPMDPARQYICPICSTKYKTKDIRYSHMKRHFLQNETKQNSTSDFNYPNELFKIYKLLKDNPSKYEDPENPFKKYLCPVCLKNYKTPDTRRDHLKTHFTKKSLKNDENSNTNDLNELLHDTKLSENFANERVDILEILEYVEDETIDDLEILIKSENEPNDFDMSSSELKISNDFDLSSSEIKISTKDQEFYNYKELLKDNPLEYENNNTSGSMPKYKCPICSKFLKTKKSRNSHLKRHFNNIDKLTKEKNTNFSNLSSTEEVENNVDQFMKFYYKLKENPSEYEDLADPNGKYKCPVCFKSFISHDIRCEHLKNHFSLKKLLKCTQYNCKNCEFKANNYFEAINHIKNKNCLNYDTDYQISNNIIDKMDLLSEFFDVVEEKSNSSYVCDICNISFDKKFSFARHRKCHLSDEQKKEYQDELRKRSKHLCSECGKYFRTNYQLNLHIKNHLGIKDYKCHLCPWAFPAKSSLTTHIKRHLDKTLLLKYECDICNKKFQDVHNLNNHKRFHIGSRDFACEICGKTYIIKNHLKVHMKRHFRQLKRFECEEPDCGKYFRKLNTFQLHQDSHRPENEKAYTCDIDNCQMRFSTSDLRNDHYELFHTKNK